MLKGDLYPRFKESAQFKLMLRNEYGNDQQEEAEKPRRKSLVEMMAPSFAVLFSDRQAQLKLHELVPLLTSAQTSGATRYVRGIFVSLLWLISLSPAMLRGLQNRPICVR